MCENVNIVAYGKAYGGLTPIRYAVLHSNGALYLILMHLCCYFMLQFFYISTFQYNIRNFYSVECHILNKRLI